MLSRIQFGFTIGFHIIFPALTIGLAWFLVFFEAAFGRTRKAVWLELYHFWVKVFALTFGMGVVTGIVLSYEFGTNWSRFSTITGPVLGPLLSAEVLTAFFVEAGFLGIMLFGWRKVGPRLHFMATMLVALGTTNSSFWILAANSWMHTPAGTTFVDGQFVPVSWLAVIFNPSFPYRLTHMLLAAGLTTTLVVAGVSALWLLKGKRAHVARAGLRVAISVLAVLAPLQIVAGDFHGQQVRDTQPVKVAAMEGLWETSGSVPFLLFAWPDEANERNHFEVKIPYAASLVLTHSLHGTVQGLKSVPARDRPPVKPVFFGFRIMVGLGFLFVALGWIGAWLWWRGSVFDNRWYLRALACSIPLGYVATLAGWVVAETGRQPWLVYNLMRTADGASPLPAHVVAASLISFVVVYTLLFIAYLVFIARMVRKGPQPPPQRHPEAMRGVRAAEIISSREG